MEHSFFTTPVAARLEALRCLKTAEKLLAGHDLLGSKSFAARAHDWDPALGDADQILAIVDTLLTGEQRIVNNQPDWYAVLRLAPQQGGDAGVVSGQYRHLALLLNPQTNRFPFAEQAFRLVVNAFSVLSNPSRRALYDRELAFYSQQQMPNPFSTPMPALSQNNFDFFGGSRGVAEQLVHGGRSGGIGGSHSAQVDQVNVQPQVEHVAGGSTRQPQNFMGYDNFVSLPGSRCKSGYATVGNQEQESYLNFGVGRGVASGSGTNQEQFHNLQKQSLHNFSNDRDETIHNVNYVGVNVNVSGNVGEIFETIDVEEDVDIVEEEGNGDDDDEKEEEENEDDHHEEEVKEEEENEDDDHEEEEKEGEENDHEEEERAKTPVVDDGLTFWTACPYCYYLYEYPQVYVDCALKCQNCKKAFHAVVISSPPPIVEGQESYLCCWGFLPFGFSTEDWNKHNVGASGWAPGCMQMGNSVNEGVGETRDKAPWVNDNNAAYVVISDSSESDGNRQDVRVKYERKQAKNVKGKKVIGITGRRAKKTHVDKGAAAKIIQDGAVSPQGAELPKKSTSELIKMSLAANAGKQPDSYTNNFGELDLNVELSIETEEPAIRTNQSGRGEDDSIEGNGFFDGLEEYLNSLPIQ